VYRLFAFADGVLPAGAAVRPGGPGQVGIGQAGSAQVGFVQAGVFEVGAANDNLYTFSYAGNV